MPDLKDLDRTSQLTLTVTGRKTGTPYAVTIWFVVDGGKIYVTSGRGPDAQWIKNLRATPTVSLDVAGRRFDGTSRWQDG